MWVWDRPDPVSLVGFARNVGAQDMFVSTPGDLATSPDAAWFTSVSSRARSAGIRVHALGAETGWIDDPTSALAWQRQALATGLFDGIHLDVEPWQHSGWGSDREAVSAAYLDLLGSLAADTTLPVEADIAFWLNEVSVGGQRLDEAVLERVDAVTVLSYRDTVTGPDSILGVADAALAAARRAGKPVRLAVETRYLGDGAVAQKQTFWGSSRRQLAAATAAVDSALAGHPTYRGVAVHDFAGWQAMREK